MKSNSLVCALAGAFLLASPAVFGSHATAGPDVGVRVAELEKPSGRLGAFIVHDEPKPMPDLTFLDRDGAERTLADWNGKVVLLNLWATWCAPCKHEMPMLDRLQARLGSDAFEVVAVSLDRGGPKKPLTFYEKAGIEHLGFYIDKTMRLGSSLKAKGMPITVLFDAEGRELGRLTGPAEWDTDEAVNFISRIAGLAGTG